MSTLHITQHSAVIIQPCGSAIPNVRYTENPLTLTKIRILILTLSLLTLDLLTLTVNLNRKHHPNCRPNLWNGGALEQCAGTDTAIPSVLPTDI